MKFSKVLALGMAAVAAANKIALDGSQSCAAHNLGAVALVQDKAASLGPQCEEMCKRMDIYPNCQCPGFAGNPASADDSRACIVKYCQDMDNKCPNDAFETCVAENTKVSALQWDAVMSHVDHGFESLLQAVRLGKAHGEASACSSQNLGVRALLQSKVETFGPQCEEMCKRMDIYPNCQCPGFAGNPASADDSRACIVKYCQDMDNKCPNDAFETCVAENTKVSALQWDAVMSRVDHGLESLVQTVRMAKAHSSTEACSSQNLGVRALLQAKVATFGPQCEEMCKRMGIYPNCQCPGFAGNPASADDSRACIVKYCQDMDNKCPNDAFETCVAENTKVSALQWDAVLSQVDNGFKSLARSVQMTKK